MMNVVRQEVRRPHECSRSGWSILGEMQPARPH